ncbi:hypothetical protein [uncultured Paraglaciecola sp.]|uniref:hypothetical protein n=1 Tax=uncultured Paraglaciecola sp. TaxID=1765024 RepID=UPI002637073C|nr:hypothetical protein [uncultured Paraglaciecola sp.]
MVRQQLFNRSLEFVAVKHLRLTEKDSLKPGDPIDKKLFKGFHIRSLYRRRIIGVKGSLWAKSMINLTKSDSSLKPEIVGEVKTPDIDKLSKVVKSKPKLKMKTPWDESASK